MAKTKVEEQELVHEAPQVYCLGTLTPISQVIPNPENPNVHPDEQLEILAGILKVNGWRQPIVVSKLSGMVVKGHGRLQTAKFMKLTEVPVDFQNYVDEQAEYQDMIADNRAAQLSYVDAFKLGNILKKVSADGQKHLGYSKEEIELFAAAEYVAPEQTDRKFVILETLKMTKESKAIIAGTVQKFCLRTGQERDWGEALAEICMAWQVVVLPTMPQAAPIAKAPPVPAPAKATEDKPKKKKKTEEAEVPVQPEGSREFEREFTVKYMAGTTLNDEEVFVIRAAEEDGARYYTKDKKLAESAKAAKGNKVFASLEQRGKDMWIISFEEVK